MIFDPRMAAAAALLMSSSPPNSNNNNNNSFCDQLNVNGLFASNTTGQKLILSPPLSIKSENANNANRISTKHFPTCSDPYLQQQPALKTSLLNEKSSFRIETIISNKETQQQNSEEKAEEEKGEEEELVERKNKNKNNFLFSSFQQQQQQFVSVQNLLAQMTGGIQQQPPGMMLMLDKQFVPSNAFNLANGEDNEGKGEI
ncbi:unnamed protein product [Meloidogyne enterolobii]|uniref:Uncharacterized protein n=1 Tax=Meloidogyne enterolobii TaxID=390850 RepID=A0ACB1AUN5_MELEN